MRPVRLSKRQTEKDRGRDGRMDTKTVKFRPSSHFPTIAPAISRAHTHRSRFALDPVPALADLTSAIEKSF